MGWRDWKQRATHQCTAVIESFNAASATSCCTGSLADAYEFSTTGVIAYAAIKSARLAGLIAGRHHGQCVTGNDTVCCNQQCECEKCDGSSSQ
mmetsp:Transcript_32564/g.73200  ORF Transcript_32564/g.73200 Transcript_32564/m.73200 type:complete len:93 (-) Transcript_32564:529-807(-)